MKNLKGIVPIGAFAVAIIISAFTTNAEVTFVTQGYELGNCTNLQNIDGGFDCSTTASGSECKINGNTAYNTSGNCSAGTGTGVLKRTP